MSVRLGRALQSPEVWQVSAYEKTVGDVRRLGSGTWVCTYEGKAIDQAYDRDSAVTKLIAYAKARGMALEPRYWFIGPESSIYHVRRDCVALTNPNRYWTPDASIGPPAGRRPCRRCA